MKTMIQMQDEMLAKCKFDGSYPKPVILPLGVLALAHNKEQEDELLRQSDICHSILFGGLILVIVSMLIVVAMISLRIL